LPGPASLVGVEPSVGGHVTLDRHRSINALAETVIGLLKAEVIRPLRPWRSLEVVEWASLDWVDWNNHRRPLEPLGPIPPAEAEARYDDNLEGTALAAQKPNETASGNPGRFSSFSAAC
jgi:hypothetical protein